MQVYERKYMMKLYCLLCYDILLLWTQEPSHLYHTVRMGFKSIHPYSACFPSKMQKVLLPACHC